SRPRTGSAAWRSPTTGTSASTATRRTAASRTKGRNVGTYKSPRPRVNARADESHTQGGPHMVTDQQIVDAIDRQGAGENTDPHSIAEHFCDLEVANGEYDGCSTDLELAFHEYE